MRRFLVTGRVLLGLAVIGFGILYLCVAVGRGLPHIGPPFLPASTAVCVVVGVALVVLGLGLLASRSAGVAALVLGLSATACAAIAYAPRVLRALHNPDPWTGGAEMLGLGAGALAIAFAQMSNGRRGAGAALGRLAEILFAATMIVFGVQHLLYGKFVAHLLLPWMPWHLFWAYFVGVAFIAAGLAILVHVQARLAAGMLGLMFSLWVVLLHGPLICGHVLDGNQWTSGLVALAMAGCSFGVAASAEN